MSIARPQVYIEDAEQLKPPILAIVAVLFTLHAVRDGKLYQNLEIVFPRDISVGTIS